MTIRRLLTHLFAALIALTMATPVALADSVTVEHGQSVRDSVESLVDYLGSDRFVVSRLELRNFSSNIVIDLQRIATEPRYEALVRARAIASLALYRDDRVAQQTVARLFEEMETTDRIYGTVVVAYGGIFAEESVEALAPLARDSRAGVRLAAVIALGRYGGQAGYELLAELMGQEKDPQVRERIESYVR